MSTSWKRGPVGNELSGPPRGFTIIPGPRICYDSLNALANSRAAFARFVSASRALLIDQPELFSCVHLFGNGVGETLHGSVMGLLSGFYSGELEVGDEEAGEIPLSDSDGVPDWGDGGGGGGGGFFGAGFGLSGFGDEGEDPGGEDEHPVQTAKLVLLPKLLHGAPGLKLGDEILNPGDEHLNSLAERLRARIARGLRRNSVLVWEEGGVEFSDEEGGGKGGEQGGGVIDFLGGFLGGAGGATETTGTTAEEKGTAGDGASGAGHAAGGQEPAQEDPGLPSSNEQDAKNTLAAEDPQLAAALQDSLKPGRLAKSRLRTLLGPPPPPPDHLHPGDVRENEDDNDSEDPNPAAAKTVSNPAALPYPVKSYVVRINMLPGDGTRCHSSPLPTSTALHLTDTLPNEFRIPIELPT